MAMVAAMLNKTFHAARESPIRAKVHVVPQETLAIVGTIAHRDSIISVCTDRVASTPPNRRLDDVS